MKSILPKAFPHGIKLFPDSSRLTEGVPLILPYCLGDVVGEVFGYCSRGVMILDVGAPCNGTCSGKKKRFRRKKNTGTILTHGSLHKIHADDTPSRTEWDVKITLFHSQPCLQLLMKYPDTGKSLFSPKTIAICCCMRSYCINIEGTLSTYIFMTYNCNTIAVREMMCSSKAIN